MSGGWSNLFRVTECSFGIFIIYIAFNSTANICSLIFSKNGYGSLGYYMLAVLFLAWGIGSIFASAIVLKLGYRCCLVTGCLTQCIWINVCALTCLKSKVPELEDSFVVS